jgi:hypothetical protein
LEHHELISVLVAYSLASVPFVDRLLQLEGYDGLFMLKGQTLDLLLFEQSPKVAQNVVGFVKLSEFVQ